MTKMYSGDNGGRMRQAGIFGLLLVRVFLANTSACIISAMNQSAIRAGIRMLRAAGSKQMEGLRIVVRNFAGKKYRY